MYTKFYTARSLEERRKSGWLTDKDIAIIRLKRLQGIPRLQLARQYKVSYRTIQRIDLHQRNYTR